MQLFFVGIFIREISCNLSTVDRWSTVCFPLGGVCVGLRGSGKNSFLREKKEKEEEKNVFITVRASLGEMKA
jgi:hypothetical protein